VRATETERRFGLSECFDRLIVVAAEEINSIFFASMILVEFDVFVCTRKKAYNNQAAANPVSANK
jgi:hypothetical protein